MACSRADDGQILRAEMGVLKHNVDPLAATPPGVVIRIGAILVLYGAAVSAHEAFAYDQGGCICRVADVGWLQGVMAGDVRLCNAGVEAPAIDTSLVLRRPNAVCDDICGSPQPCAVNARGFDYGCPVRIAPGVVPLHCLLAGGVVHVEQRVILNPKKALQAEIGDDLQPIERLRRAGDGFCLRLDCIGQDLHDAHDFPDMRVCAVHDVPLAVVKLDLQESPDIAVRRNLPIIRKKGVPLLEQLSLRFLPLERSRSGGRSCCWLRRNRRVVVDDNDIGVPVTTSPSPVNVLGAAGTSCSEWRRGGRLGVYFLPLIGHDRHKNPLCDTFIAPPGPSSEPSFVALCTASNT